MSHWGRRPSRTFPVQQQPPWNSFLPRRVETPHRCPDRGESYISIATPTTWRAILFVSSRQTGKKTLRRAMDNRRFTRVCLGARTIEHNRKKKGNDLLRFHWEQLLVHSQNWNRKPIHFRLFLFHLLLGLRHIIHKYRIHLTAFRAFSTRRCRICRFLVRSNRITTNGIFESTPDPVGDRPGLPWKAIKSPLSLNIKWLLVGLENRRED